MLYENDTIAAIATPEGEGGISMVRVSGREAERIFASCFQRMSDEPVRSHTLYYGHVIDQDGKRLDEAMGVLMRAPRSYTRETVCELHCHGGFVTVRRVLARVLRLGARAAHPGEFTYRAFLNGRISLNEAEAVMSLIQAKGSSAARSALSQMEGGVSKFVLETKKRLENILSLIEASNDFPEEIDEEWTKEQIQNEIRSIKKELVQSSDENAARFVRDGISVVIVGKPNVGKSSLMNALLGQDRSIVTKVPGTTRDILTERILFNGVAIELSDTAGQRETNDEIEKIGIERAKKAERNADCVLMVLNASQPMDDQDRALLHRADHRTIFVLNKSDLRENSFDPFSEEWDLPAEKGIAVSALNRSGMDRLIEKITETFHLEETVEKQMTIERHIECARRAVSSLDQALDSVKKEMPVDLCAIDLTRALSCLNEITGENTSETVIARIFERFCVGK